MSFNILLQEATENKDLNTGKVAQELKRQLNTCKLTRYSKEPCAKFYSSFFLQSLEDSNPSVADWGAIYTQLLSEDKFCEDLSIFMVNFRPSIYEGLFIPLWAEIQSEATRHKNDRVRYLQMTKAMMTMIHSRMAGIANMVKSQISDINSLKFCSTVEQTLSKMCFDIQALINTEIAASVSPDDITYARNVATVPLTESMQDLLDLLEHCGEWYDSFMAGIINEGIVGDASMKVKEMKLAQKKAERQFDEMVMNKIRIIREERRNAKHAEMVGESLRVMREIKRILKFAPIALLSPIAAAIVYLCSIFYDRATDRKDRKILVDQLRDELEITNEKIQMAERNGDDKARIELIRFRQKLEREYERIMHVRYDAQTAARHM